MQASLLNLYKQLISENFLLFVNVHNFLQNTCTVDILQNRETFLRLYKSDVSGKRGYVWIDCDDIKIAFEMIHKHDCFIYKIRVQSFDEDQNSENLESVCAAARFAGFTAFVEHNFVVFPVDRRHLNDSTAAEFEGFADKQPVVCCVCEKTVKNERGLKRHIKLYHSSQPAVRVLEEV